MEDLQLRRSLAADPPANDARCIAGTLHMLALPSAETLAAFVADPRFMLAAGVALLSGLVRGFSGFGSALIYIPLVSAIYEPRIGVVTLLLIDFACGTPFAIRESRRCNWAQLLPVTLGAVLCIPLGTLALQYADPVLLRWIMAALVLLLLSVLASGWRYQVTPRLPYSLAAGALSGLGAGAVQIAAPPVLIYWLGGKNSAVTIRANLMVYFILLEIVSITTYSMHGLFSADLVLLSLLLGPLFIVAMAAGAWMFRDSAEQTYRRIAYLITAVSAILALPLFDELFR
jgi:uncharacterized membrane protein YfcA